MSKYAYFACNVPVSQRAELNVIVQRIKSKKRPEILLSYAWNNIPEHNIVIAMGLLDNFYTSSLDSSDKLISMDEFLGLIERRVEGEVHEGADLTYRGEHAELNRFVKQYYPHLLEINIGPYKKLIRLARLKTGARQKALYRKANRLLRKLHVV
jgi:hypothetical protein